MVDTPPRHAFHVHRSVPPRSYPRNYLSVPAPTWARPGGMGAGGFAPRSDLFVVVLRYTAYTAYAVYTVYAVYRKTTTKGTDSTGLPHLQEEQKGGGGAEPPRPRLPDRV